MLLNWKRKRDQSQDKTDIVVKYRKVPDGRIAEISPKERKCRILNYTPPYKKSLFDNEQKIPKRKKIVLF